MIKLRKSLGDSPSVGSVQWRFIGLSSLFFIAATLIFVVSFSALRIDALKAEQATTASVLVSQLIAIVEKTEEPALDELVKGFLAIQVGVRVFACINLSIDSMGKDYYWPSKNCLDFQDRESPDLQITSSRADDPSARITITAIVDEDAPIHQYAREAIQIVVSALLMGLFALLAVNFAFNRAVRQPLKNLLDDLLNALTGYEGSSANNNQKGLHITQFASAYEAMFDRAKELKRQEAFWRTIVDRSFDCIISADSEGRIIDFNPAAEKTFGYQRDRILGCQIGDMLIPKRHQAAYNEGREHYLATAENHTIGKILKTEALKSDRTEITVEVSIAIITLDSERYFTAYLRDVTEANRTLAVLKESKAFLEQSAEIANLGYAIWDDVLDKDVTVSEELARIHGLTRDEYLETINSMEAYLELVVPFDREKYIDYETQFAADSGGKAAGVEYRIMRPDGEIRHLHQRSQYVPAPSGEPTQSIVVIQDITDQKQVEYGFKKSREALAESEAMLTQSVAMANLGHAIWDYVNDKYISVSEGWASIFGYTRKEFLAMFTNLKKDRELIHPEDRDRYQAYYDNTEEEADIEYRIIRRDGKTRHLLQRYQYFSNESPKQTKSLVTIQDITDRIEIAKGIRTTADELALLIETANAPIIGIGTDGLINEWNQCAFRITGYKKDEALGRPLVDDFIADHNKPFAESVLNYALMGDESENCEFVVRTKTGKYVDVLANSTTRRDIEGKIVGVIGIGQDVTERKQTESALRLIEERFSAMLEASPVGILLTDLDGRFLIISQAYREWHGIKGVVDGKTVYDFFPASDANILSSQHREVIKLKSAMQWEVEMPSVDGNRITVHAVKFPIFGSNQDLVAIGSINIDITDRKRSAAQLIQATKLTSLGEMATSLAHELNQPLNVIQMAAGNVLRKFDKGKTDLEYVSGKLERIITQTKRAADIINHMQIFGRDVTEKPSPLQPYDMIEGALDLMGEQLRLLEIEINLSERPENCPDVLGHQVQIEQVILNLLINARDAILENLDSTQKRIYLGVEVRETQFVDIIVEDTGGGVPDHIIDHIFDPFYTTKAIGKGTGLGLSVSYGIIRDMNGKITIENINEGARFKIRLPTVDT